MCEHVCSYIHTHEHTHKHAHTERVCGIDMVSCSVFSGVELYSAPREDSRLCTFSLFVEFLSHTVG